MIINMVAKGNGGGREEREHFYIENRTGTPGTVTITKTQSTGTSTEYKHDPELYYSNNDGVTWTAIDLTGRTQTTVATFPIGAYEKIYIKNNYRILGETANNYINIKCNVSHNVGGRLTGLLNDLYGESCYDYSFKYLFFQNVMLVSAGDLLLPLNVGIESYRSMFYGCSILVTPPELPALTLASYCYAHMFRDTAVVAMPELPAQNLADHCYYQMFYGCTQLTAATRLPARKAEANCYESMFQSCTSLRNAPEIDLYQTANYCCSRMFNGCTNLITPPSTLNTATVSSYAYAYMFENCSSLLSTPAFKSTHVYYGGFYQTFESCTALTIAKKVDVTEIDGRGCYRMFYNCTSLQTPPALPATTLAAEAYQLMFAECSALKNVPALPWVYTSVGGSVYDAMFRYCSSLVVMAAPSGIYNKEWRIPKEGTSQITDTEYYFLYRISAASTAPSNLALVSGQAVTYYVQNEPVE